MDYSSYAEILALCTPHIDGEDDVAEEEALLDPENGFPIKMMGYCRQQIQEAEDPTRDFDMPDDELESFKLERDTWDLVQLLYGYRKSVPPPVPTPSQHLSLNPYTPPDVLLNSILKTSIPSASNTTALEELLLIITWLQSTAPNPPPISTAIGYRRFTKSRLLQAQRTGQWGAMEGIVRELDPDSMYRIDEGRGRLASEDEANEQALLRAIFMYIRAGRMDDVSALCRAANEPWRGAFLRGGVVASCGSLGSDLINSDGVSQDAPNYKWTGNKRRRLFKSICTRAALDPTSSSLSRLLYATLAPSHTTLHILLGGLGSGGADGYCRTWADILWARVNMLFEERWEYLLEKYERYGKARPREFMAIDDNETGTGNNWEEDVKKVLEHMESAEVDEGPGASNPYHITQLYIILNRVDLLFDRVADLFNGVSIPSEDEGGGAEYFKYTHYLRFFAHLCLFFRYINVPLPPTAANTILQAYVNLLEYADQRPLLAQYSAALGESAIDRYALYLSSLPLDVPVYERIEALNLAEKSGLDVHRVAIRACEDGAADAFNVMPRTSDLTTLEIVEDQELSIHEQYLVRCMEWTINTPETYECALRMSNRCVRYFLSSGKPQAASAILAYLPLDLISLAQPPPDEETKSEHLGWRLFMKAWISHDHVAACVDSEMDVEGDDERNRWLRSYSEALDECWTCTIELLVGEWLMSVVGDDSDPRQRDFDRIRKIYVPELALRLHDVLFNSRRCFSKSHARIFELVNIIADRRYSLHEEFLHSSGIERGEQMTILEIYLKKVMSTAVAALENGGNDPFVGAV